MSWGIAAVAIGVAAARFALVLTDPAEAGAVAGVKVPARDLASVIPEWLLVASFGVTGGLLASQKPRNPIGWLLLTTGMSFAMLLLSERLGWHYLLADGAITDRVAWWLWVADWVWIPAVVPIFIFIPLLFPTGRPPSPRWRFVLWAATFIVASLLVSAALAPGPLQNYVAVESPAGTAEALNVATVVLLALSGLAALASVASLALRFKHSHGVEHQQIMWMWAAGALLVVPSSAARCSRAPPRRSPRTSSSWGWSRPRPR